MAYSSYQSKKAAEATNQSAFQSVNQSIIGNNIYDVNNPAVQPYLNYINATDATAKAFYWQKLYAGLVSSNNMAPAGSKFRNNFEYLQTVLRGLGLSKATTQIGVLDPQGKDQTAFSTALQGAIGMNLSLPDYLALLSGTGFKTGGTKVAQLDTTTKYNKNISTALQLMDETDAKSYFAESYFKAYGQNPSEDLIKRFGSAWNAQVKAQTKPTTTEYVTTYEKVYDTKKPIIDPKTKKPKLDANGKPMYQQKVNAAGQLQWKPITKQVTTSTGMGFTQAEQDKFLAEFMVSNFPDADFDTTSIGGASRSVYDEIVALHKSNYSAVPDFSTVAGTIKAVLGTADAAVAKEVLSQYGRKLRDAIATKYMSLADWVNAGNNASEKIEPLITAASTFLESDVTLEDNLMKQILNYQGSDGKYRLPNEYELNQLLVNDSRYARTSTARNESINAGQALTSRLGL